MGQFSSDLGSREKNLQNPSHVVTTFSFLLNFSLEQDKTRDSICLVDFDDERDFALDGERKVIGRRS